MNRAAKHERAIRVILADDHPAFRLGVKSVIEEWGAAEVVGEADAGEACLTQINRLSADVVIVDLAMAGMDGFQVLKKVSSMRARPLMVVASMYSDSDMVDRAFALGAVGFLAKEDVHVALPACIETVLAGRIYISQSVGAAAPQPPTPDGEGTDNLVERLSPAQKSVLRLIADGMTSKEIARALDIAPRTVDAHRLQIARKLNLRGAGALAAFAGRVRRRL